MNAEELIEHCNQIAAHMRQIRGEPADRLVHIPLGPVSQNRYEQLRSINLPGVAVRHALYNLERPRTGLVPMLMLIFDHVEVSVTGEPDYGEAA